MKVITRAEWGAKYGAGNLTSGAKLHTFLHHTGVSRPACGGSLEEFFRELRRIEKYHADGLTKANPRIAYTHCCDANGNVAEGTGWGRIGAHTKDRNSSSYAFVLFLDGEKDEPTNAQVEKIDWWRAEGVRLGHLDPRHDLRGHSDVLATSCPGRKVYDRVLRGTSRAPVVRGADAVAAMPSLRKGSGGSGAPADIHEAVRELQRRLGMPESHRTGFFGSITEGRVRGFQQASGLKVDGIVGPSTWKALLSR
jgi:hypothetical protein